MPPSREVSCRTSKLSRSPRQRAMLPFRPEVSTATTSMLDTPGSVFHQFEQHASGARRVNEHVEVPACADLDVFGDQTRARCLQAGDRASEVGNVQRNVMQSFATLL